MADLERFLKRNKIKIEKILYIYHHDRKTVVCAEPGGEVTSSAPLQEVLAFLPEEDFISISRNAIVRRDKIISISHDGVYTMLDGKTFQGRTGYLSTHRRLYFSIFMRFRPTISSTLPGYFSHFCILFIFG